ncbi:hypothetical protein [Picosynechococcus sp. PCC 7117]|uniref:hypothetical protein n=1 Tax=Picosynechococcus sp. PCC 7117 TaxID=195498 RepID=UPI000810EA40|nr:hypothetical protein [Picosynechococcus sp. PCC 7117]ANV88505.1 hypothetical protein AWQ22_14115 [Picosynechococcus sp. PCC 7117]
MTTVLGTIKDSAGNVLDGVLTVTLAGSMVNAVENVLFTPNPFSFDIVNGVVNIDLEESESKNTSYEFNFFPYRLNETVDPPVLELSNVPVAPFPFNAVVPQFASVNLADLAPTGIVTDVLDTGALRVAQLIAEDQNLSDQVGGVFPLGEWDNATEYKRGSIVTYQGDSYVASTAVPAAILPTDTDYWMFLASSGGAGASADLTPYGLAWDGSDLIPTQNTVYDEVEAVKTSINTKAPIDSPTLTGTVTLPSTTSIGNVSSTELGYLDGVTSGIQTQINSKANSASPTFTGTVTLPSTTSIGLVSSTELGYLDGVTSSLQTQLNSKANLASPSLTGTPTAPTATAGTNTTQLSTTAFVQTAISNLNLGTAATLNAGTAANNVVQLDGSSRLPAVDGSQLLNLPSGFSDPMTTRGDIIYRNSSNVTARLGLGTNGQVLGSDGVDLIWTTPSGGGGLDLEVLDEGVSLTTAATSINIVGPYITATNSSGAVTITSTAGNALTTQPLSQFASTTSAQLASVISNETGSGSLVFSGSPSLTGTPTATTASRSTNNTQIATTAFVQNVIRNVTTSTISSGTLTINLSTTEITEVTLNQNITTWNLSNFFSGLSKLTVFLIQDGTGGRTVAFPASWIWAGGIEPTITSTALARDIIHLVSPDSGTTIYATLIGQGYS